MKELLIVKIVWMVLWETACGKIKTLKVWCLKEILVCWWNPTFQLVNEGKNFLVGSWETFRICSLVLTMNFKLATIIKKTSEYSLTLLINHWIRIYLRCLKKKPVLIKWNNQKIKISMNWNLIEHILNMKVINKMEINKKIISNHNLNIQINWILLPVRESHSNQ